MTGTTLLFTPCISRSCKVLAARNIVNPASHGQASTARIGCHWLDLDFEPVPRLSDVTYSRSYQVFEREISMVTVVSLIFSQPVVLPADIDYRSTRSQHHRLLKAACAAVEQDRPRRRSLEGPIEMKVIVVASGEVEDARVGVETGVGAMLFVCEADRLNGVGKEFCKYQQLDLVDSVSHGC